MANWSDLPVDVVYHLANKLPHDVEEYVNFGAVCKSWNSCFIILKNRSVTYSPWLMLTKRKNDNKISEDNALGIRSFYSLSSKKIFNFELPTQGKRCWGTPYPGWVFTFGVDFQINLLNLVSGDQISLPPQQTLRFRHCITSPDYLRPSFISNVCVATNPSESDQRPLVMVIHGSYCASIARPGDEAWQQLDYGFPHNAEDVIFFNGQFYIVDSRGRLGFVEITSTQASARQIASPPEGVKFYNRFYLVEIAGVLYFVERVLDTINGDIPRDEYSESDNEEDEEIEDEADDEEDENINDEEPYYKTSDFLVFKYDPITRNWARVSDLGDHAFFLGNNTSFSMSTSQRRGFKSNCIYFTDDNSIVYPDVAPCDMGVYDISRGRIEPIFVIWDTHSLFSRPLFFLPTL